MYIISYDPETGIIESYGSVVHETNMAYTMTFKGNSYITGNEMKYIDLESMVHIPTDIQQQIRKYPPSYVVINDEFKIRPYVTVSVLLDTLTYTKAGETLLPIGVDVPLRVSYSDPDNVGFIDKFDYIKIKDRNDFITLPITQQKITRAVPYFNITIRSDFPGVTVIRAKDNKYLSAFNVLPVKFSQKVTS